VRQPVPLVALCLAVIAALGVVAAAAAHPAARAAERFLRRTQHPDPTRAGEGAVPA
jgi:hypothetical protein